MTYHRTLGSCLMLCFLMTIATVASAEVSEERIEELEQELERLKTEVQQKTNRLQTDMQEQKESAFNLNGFMTTGAARASNDAGFDGVTGETEIQSLTKLGIQGTLDMTDQTSATFQLLSRGKQRNREDFEVQLEWGYLSYEMDSGLRLRAGKMRQPLFYFSDSLDVGFSQPWARAPRVVYQGEGRLSSFTGIDATYRFDVAGIPLRSQIYAGITDDQSVNVELRNLVGAVVSWTNYTWTLRAVATRNDAEFQIIDRKDDSFEVNFQGLAAEYDDGNLNVISEGIRREAEGPFPDIFAYYITTAYRLGDFKPYFNFGWINSVDDSRRRGVTLARTARVPTPGGIQELNVPARALNERRNEFSLGMRYDLFSGVALKGDYTHVRSFDDTSGGLSGNRSAAFTGENNFGNSNIYTVTLDAVF